MKKMIAPSILAANFAHLSKDIEMVNESECADWFHIDIMDGRFVPNISFGFPVVKAIQSQAKKPMDIHLMIVEPEKYLQKFADLGADVLTVHYEACPHLHRTIQSIQAMGIKAGVALNPHTPVSLLENIIAEVDLVLLMSVNPGFGGQSFIENTYQKIRQCKTLIETHQSSALIEIDGGVNTQNAQQLFEAGADILVAGSAVFGSDDPAATICQLKASS